MATTITTKSGGFKFKLGKMVKQQQNNTWQIETSMKYGITIIKSSLNSNSSN